ncbi:Aqualysin-1 [Drechslerella dactyloides]|uniref:Aqualysin-1 n=1 Tax=Drechslerella dactyloides TaxID=74499 RepID=A0AAD6J810_DREDA|nr:Aqualysin-1 [Drechslerella dactyloides]
MKLFRFFYIHLLYGIHYCRLSVLAADSGPNQVRTTDHEHDLPALRNLDAATTTYILREEYTPMKKANDHEKHSGFETSQGVENAILGSNDTLNHNIGGDNIDKGTGNAETSVRSNSYNVCSVDKSTSTCHWTCAEQRGDEDSYGQPKYYEFSDTPSDSDILTNLAHEIMGGIKYVIKCPECTPLVISVFVKLLKRDIKKHYPEEYTRIRPIILAIVKLVEKFFKILHRIFDAILEEYQYFIETASAELERRSSAYTLLIQVDAPWGLARIPRRKKVPPSHRRKSMDKWYCYPALAGSGVDIYVVDTGVAIKLPEFGGRAKNVYPTCAVDDGEVVDGHGTSVAAVLGSRSCGVAKKANIRSVNVHSTPTNRECVHTSHHGWESGISDGIEHVVTLHKNRMNESDFNGSVINLSICMGGMPPSGRLESKLHAALRGATEAGIHVVVAAGNSNADACSCESSRFSQTLPIISVGATDMADRRARFSNYGRSYYTSQGTSLAAPHVAGVIATWLPDLKLNPKGMKQLILSHATPTAQRGAESVRILNNELRI